MHSKQENFLVSDILQFYKEQLKKKLLSSGRNRAIFCFKNPSAATGPKIFWDQIDLKLEATYTSCKVINFLNIFFCGVTFKKNSDQNMTEHIIIFCPNETSKARGIKIRSCWHS